MAIPNILSRFSEQHPNVHLEIHTLNSVQQLHAVEAMQRPSGPAP